MFSNPICDDAIGPCRAPACWAAIAGWLLAGLLSPALAAAAEPLTVAVSRSAMSLPVFVAEERGYFREAGVTVRTQECLGGQRCMAEVLDGRVQVATVAEISVAFQSFLRNDFSIIATLVQADQYSKIIVRRSVGITGIAGLAGKRVATVKSTSAHYHLDSALLLHRVDPKQLALDFVQPEQVGPALLGGKVDAAVVWEPFAHETLQALGADGLALPSPKIYATTFELVALRSTITSHAAELERLLQALGRAVQYIKEQPASAQAILRARAQVDQGFIDATWRDYRYELSLGQPLLSTLEGQVRWALREGHVPAGSRPANMLPFVDPGPLRRVWPQAVTLVK